MRPTIRAGTGGLGLGEQLMEKEGEHCRRQVRFSNLKVSHCIAVTSFRIFRKLPLS